MCRREETPRPVQQRPPKRDDFVDAAREHVRRHLEAFRELAKR